MTTIDKLERVSNKSHKQRKQLEQALEKANAFGILRQDGKTSFNFT